MGPVGDTLALAEVLAKEATASGGKRMGEARERAEAALSRVAEALEAMDDLETRASLPERVKRGSRRLAWVLSRPRPSWIPALS